LLISIKLKYKIIKQNKDNKELMIKFNIVFLINLNKLDEANEKILKVDVKASPP
tara:strand:+ start:573 stop:734 length:162 start_codon:yes stop_codon:yes gene_type:complete